MYGTAYRSLSLLPLQSTHLKIDWINTGHHKNLDTIRKQNYQEPGVEAELAFCQALLNEYCIVLYIVVEFRVLRVFITIWADITSAMLC